MSHVQYEAESLEDIAKLFDMIADRTYPTHNMKRAEILAQHTRRVWQEAARTVRQVKMKPAPDERLCSYNGGTCKRRGCAIECHASKLIDELEKD